MASPVSPIERLPCEVLASILRNLGNIRFLLPSILACRSFHSAFKEFPGIVVDILLTQISPDLVPCAIVVQEAASLEPTDKSAVWKLVDTLSPEHAPTELVSRLRAMPVSVLAKMAYLHDAIGSLATEFASTAWAHLSKQEGSRVSGQLSLSPTEYTRFCHAFYRVELYSVLALNSHSTVAWTDDPEELQPASGREDEWLYARHLPWQNEQVASTLEFLEFKLVQASHEFGAHEVNAGYLRLDYLTAGRENGWRQIWLSQGVGYIHKLARQTSYLAKGAVLMSVFALGPHWLWPLATPYRGLQTPSDDEADDDETPLADYSAEDLATRFPTLVDNIADKGPFRSWWTAFANLPRYEWPMPDDHAGLRKRAYVFWDQDRLEYYSMLQLFRNAPPESELQASPKDIDAMKESFEERRKIFKKGGRGYWSKGDLSRIIWLKQEDQAEEDRAVGGSG